MKSQRRSNEKILAAVTLVVVIGAVTYTMVIEPQLKARKKLITEMRGKQLELIKMKGEMLLKDRVEQTYREMESLIQGFGSDQQEISEFSRELNDLYSKLSVSIRSVKILPLLREEHYRKLFIRTEMAGAIRDIARFVSAVETQAKPLRIEQLNLTAGDAVDHVRASFLLTKVVSVERLDGLEVEMDK
jgi:Tfp pilus assembly protein PilO